jgi:hypothetical protein
VFENRVLRRIFGPEMDMMTGEWRKLHDEELHNLYSSPNIIRIMKARENAYRILVGNPGGKRPLGRPRRRWVDNIKMDLIEIGRSGMDRWSALVNTIMNLPFP